MTARVIANKFGGGGYEQGQVITQSEYNDYKAKRAEAIATADASKAKANQRQSRRERIAEIKTNINNRGKDKFRQIIEQEGDVTDKALSRFDRSKAGKQFNALGRMEGSQRSANAAAIANGSGNRAKRRAGQRVAPRVMRDNPFTTARSTKRLPGVRRRRSPRFA
jgi:hypothetical protein